MRVANRARALRSVGEGFHRHDRATTPALPPVGEAQLGQQVKLQVNLICDLPCAAYPGEATDWLAMGGTVTRVLSADRVIAELCPTTDRAPLDFDGDWIVELQPIKPVLKQVLTSLPGIH